MPYDEYSSLWEGNSPNATHAYERMKAAGDAPDNSWLEGLFGRRKKPSITSQPLPAMEPTDSGTFPPSPFQAPAPAPKPASKLSSGAELAKRISGMIAAANEPPPVSPADFGLSPSEYQRPEQDPLAAVVNQYPADEPPPPRVPINMRDEPRSGYMASLGVNARQLEEAFRVLLGGGHKFGGNTYGGEKFGGNTFGGNLFGGSQFGASAPRDPGETGGWPAIPSAIGGNTFGGNLFGGATFGGNKFGGRRFGKSAGLPPVADLPQDLPYAEGGDVPGFMRGGYPELYNAPIRHFDSGGESYVGDHSSADGRADDVSAKLSAKEYVVDAETMSMLGNGNPDHGAKKMDQFRANVRKHKGKALAQGKFSPNAKNPAEYLIGNPMGDGMRRQGKSK